MCLTFYTCS